MEEPEKYFYEKAIQGLEFHTSRFNTWMNLYAIFVGAFFIAYYNVSEKSNSNFVSTIVIMGGFIATVCWFCSLLGYYSWLLSWTKILHFHEDNLVKKNKRSYRVHSMIEETYLTKTGFSTQKITIVFIFIVMILWLCLLGYQLHQVYQNDCCAYYIAISAPLLIAGLVWGLIFLFRKHLMSNIKSHYVLYQRQGGTYEIKEPTQ